MVLQKYCASGNDFLIFHSFKKEDRAELAKKVCDRHFGFGADGLIALIPYPTLDYEWDFYNSDGSYAAMCGNGTRACTMYAYDNGLGGKNQKFLTGAGEISTEIFEGGDVETAMTKPAVIQDRFDEEGFSWIIIDTGVPHLVAETEHGFFDSSLAAMMRHKYNANVNFFSKKEGILHVRTFERGVEGETLACGSGMSACGYSIAEKNGVLQTFDVRPKSGEKITIKVLDEQIWFRGGVKRVGACLN